MKITLNENEKDQISSQYEEINSRLFNFLLRRVKIKERNLGGDYGDEVESLIVIEYTFQEYPGWGFNSFDTKKKIESSIIDMLWENDVIDFYPYDLDERDPKRVKIIKTIRKFLNFMLSGKK
jgi:hypothetical protein